MAAKLAVVLVVFAARPAMNMTDPAPPTVRPLPRPAPVVSPRRHRRVTVFGSPRALARGAVAGDWPCFLGPTHNAVCPETHLRKDLRGGPDGRGPRLLWQLQTGEGYSAPSVCGERVVVFHRLGAEEVVECLHAVSGRLYWQVRWPTRYRDRYGYNNGPRATPAIAGGRVYAYGAEGVLCCIDLAGGHVYWRRDLGRELNLRRSFFGAGSSPLVEGGLVILNVGAAGGPAVAAFDARTGRLVWGAETEWGAGYASPVPATLGGRRVVFVFAGGWSDPPTGGLLCLDARTGATYFRYPWRARRVESVNASSPVVVGQTVFISSIYKAGLSGVILRVGADLSARPVARTRYGAHWMTPIARGGRLYGFEDSSLVCTDLRTGAEVWRVARPLEAAATPAGDPAEAPTKRGVRGPLGRASMLFADGAFLALGEWGELCWLELTERGMKVLSRATLFAARQSWTCPVISRGLLYVRQNEPDPVARRPRRLLCYDLRAAAGEAPGRARAGEGE